MGTCSSGPEEKEKKRKAKNRVEFNQRLDSVYMKYNHDGSNVLSRAEVAQLIKDSLAGRDDTLTESELEEFIDALGKDNGGKIYKEDMFNLFRRLQQGDR